MVNSLKFPPLLSASAGAVVSYYTFAALRFDIRGNGLWLLLPLAFLFVFLSFVRVCALGPDVFFADAGGRRFFRLAELYFVFFSTGLVLGFGAGGAFLHEPEMGLPEERIDAVLGILVDDPRTFYDGRGMGTIALRRSRSGSTEASAAGNLSVFFPEEAIARLKEFGRGCEIYVEGTIRHRASPESRSSGKAGDRRRAEPFLQALSVHVTKTAPAIEKFRTGLRLFIIQRFAGKDWGGFSLALLLGFRDNLDSDLAESFRNAGSSHVLALSGMHLALVSAVVTLLLKRPLGLRAAALAGAAFILFYVFLTGVQPSLERAAIMYLLGTLAVLGAMRRDPLNLLGLSFLLQILLRPWSATGVSFILSYLALAGILVTGESIAGIFRGKIPAMVLRPLAASVGAFVATMPVSVFFFGILRPVGIAAGLIIVPLTSLFMILSMVWFVVILTVPVLAGPFGAVLSLLYRILSRVVVLAARFPPLSGIGTVPAVLVSIGLSVFLILLDQRLRHFRNRLDPFPL
ncbi:MAG: ComEC/Rec2 family competence protein [Treponema sp.]|jgi:competence protein ComEC|nr:ComEC/Rec2 family competence protein [Treponema sp.]